VEFVLVGIPIIFMLISLFEIARGMWMYHTVSYAVREATRYVSMHGSGCASPNSCQITVGNIAQYIQSAGPGIDPASTLTLTPATGSATSGTITSLSASNTTWPPSTANTPGNLVTINVKYPFRTVLSIFWPGSGGALNDSQTFYLPATSAATIQF
jgi:Flp pilus assembly protein TadG